MRVNKPYISVHRDKKDKTKFRVSALFLPQKGRTAKSLELIYDGVKQKTREDGSVINCSKFIISLKREPGFHHWLPLHFKSKSFLKDSNAEFIWVTTEGGGFGGSPDEGGVGNYEDPDGN